MTRILFVKSNPEKKRVQLGLEENDGEATVLKVRESTYTSFGSPERGSYVTDETLDALRYDDELLRAYKKAVGMLADSDKSRYEMAQKLRYLGYSKEIIDTVLGKCEEYGYLDEDRQLERLIERETNRKLRGRYYVKRKLMAKGYRSSAIDRITDLLVERGDIDFDANFKHLAQKKGADDENAIMTLKYKYGYKI